MRKPFLLPGIAALLALCSISISQISAQTLVKNRVTSLASHPGRAPVPNNVIPRALRATDLGPAPASAVLESMSLRFTLSTAQQQALGTLEAAQQNPSSSSYRQWLTPEQYGARFGLSTDDLAQVTSWLAAQGFTNVQVARSRSFVTFSGTAAQVDAAFATTIHSLQADGENHVANLTDPTVPSAFASVVGTVTGLDDFKLKPHVKTRTVPAPNPQFTSSISGNHYLAPGDLYTIYDINPLLNASINGAGVTIAVMGQTDIIPADIAAFRSASGLSTNVPTIKLYGTDPFISQNDLPEASLDVEWSGAVAPAATILYVNSTNVLTGSLTQAIDNNLAPIITISYGDCETGFGSSSIAMFNQLFRQANVQGQTILGPGGDTGATDCDYNNSTGFAVGGLAVDFPASSPYVTGVGGTEFNEGGGTYFAATNGAFQGSALSYIPEMAWNDVAVGGGLAAGGGGPSAFFTKPPYQVGTGVPNDFSRDVPDVSFSASADHDGYLFCVSGFCTNGFRNATNNLDVVGGTSVSTPAYAGIMALLQQKIKAQVGNANPVIYGLANSIYYPAIFHDVTVGSNASPCSAGSTNCPNGGSIGFNATVGYDLATGWGSIDATQMVNDWLLVTPAGSTSTQGFNTVSVTLNPTLTSVSAGAADNVAVTVTSVTPGLTAVPTGTAQLLIDNAPTGSTVALVNGTASFAIPTTGLASGGHTISVAYSGDTNYTGAKGSFMLDIISAVVPDFSISPSTSALTVSPGATSAGITYTLSPVNGFTGPITLTAIETSSTLIGSYTFSIDPVTITSTSPGTTVFTLSAFQQALQTGVGQGKFGPSGSAANEGPTLPGKTTGWQLAGTRVAMAALCMLVLPRRRRRWGALLIGLLSVGMLAISGCSQNGAPGNLNSAPGVYTIIVTATNMSNTISHNATIVVTIPSR